MILCMYIMMSSEFVNFQHSSNVHLRTNYHSRNYSNKLSPQNDNMKIYKIHLEFDGYASQIEDYLQVSKEITDIRKYIEKNINLLMINWMKDNFDKRCDSVIYQGAWNGYLVDNLFGYRGRQSNTFRT